MANLEIRKLSLTYKNMLTLDDVSIRVADNEVVVIVGPSGCGKSTLLHIIAGLLRPDQGQVYIDGEKVTGRTGIVSYMQQKDLLLPFYNIIDNICIPLVLKGINSREAREMAVPYLKDFALEDFAYHYPRQLSGGMKQRAALLRTFLFSQDILLLDEPFASLDAITRHKMHLWLLKLHQKHSSSILFVTHDIEEALLLADRIYILSSRPAKVRMEIDTAGLKDDQAKMNTKNKILELLESEVSDVN